MEHVLLLPLPFEQVYEDTYDLCLRLAFVLCGSWPRAEQITGAVFAAARDHWGQVGADQQPAARLKREVAERAFARGAWQRRRGRLGAGRRPVDGAGPPDDDGFWAAVRRLPPRQAQAVALYYLEGCSSAAVAGVLGSARPSPGPVDARWRWAPPRSPTGPSTASTRPGSGSVAAHPA